MRETRVLIPDEPPRNKSESSFFTHTRNLLWYLVVRTYTNFENIRNVTIQITLKAKQTKRLRTMSIYGKLQCVILYFKVELLGFPRRRDITAVNLQLVSKVN